MELAEKIYYNGYYINVFYDDDVYSPADWSDDVFLVHYHRDFWVDNKNATRDEIVRWYRNENEEIEKKYWIFPVSAYIHGGVVLSMGSGKGFPDYEWDVSHVGAVLAERKRIKTAEDAYDECKSVVEEWNDYLSGDVYGYDIEDENKNMVGHVCAGFYGDYHNSGLLDEAKSEIDAEIKDRCKDAIESHKKELEILESIQPTKIY